MERHEYNDRLNSAIDLLMAAIANHEMIDLDTLATTVAAIIHGHMKFHDKPRPRG